MGQFKPTSPVWKGKYAAQTRGEESESNELRTQMQAHLFVGKLWKN